MDGAPQGSVLIRIAHIPNLLQRVSGRRFFHHIEFEEIDIAEYGHIDAAVVGGFLGADIQPQRRKIAVEHADIKAFVLRNGVSRVAKSGNGTSESRNRAPRKKDLQRCYGNWESKISMGSPAGHERRLMER